MGFMDKIKDTANKVTGGKAKDVAADHGDKIVDAVDKGTDIVDDKTGGKAGAVLDKVDEGAADVVEKLAE